MIRRPRYPLTLRLGWIESEIDAAGRLAQLMVTDMKTMVGRVEGADARVAMLATVCCAALVPLGVDPRVLEAFVEQLIGGDLAEAEVLATDIVLQVLHAMARADEDDEDGADEVNGADGVEH